MDAVALGRLIRQLRTERGLTQLELAQQLCVTDKAVSKWERGQGCPDVSLFPTLAAALQVDVASLLKGALPPGKVEGGNMKRTQWYLCPQCGNVITAAGPAEISCCGRRMEPVNPTPADPAHMPRLEKMDDEYCITFDHPMTKEHFIRFVAWMGYDRLLMIRLYPEQDALVRIPQARQGTLLIGCSQHGLLSVSLRQLL